jgi:hypothetical protein
MLHVIEHALDLMTSSRGPRSSLDQGAEAVLHLARLPPAGAPIASLADTFPGTTGRAYRWIGRHRDLLGRAVGERACGVDPVPRVPRSRNTG